MQNCPCDEENNANEIQNMKAYALVAKVSRCIVGVREFEGTASLMENLVLLHFTRQGLANHKGGIYGSN